MNTNITQITKRIQEYENDNVIIGLTGGSASGKSFLSNQLCLWGVKNGFDVVVLHQDDFALGRTWKGKSTSEYRWDDPDNYRLDEAYNVLSDFLMGKTVPFNAYDLDAHEPHSIKTLEWLRANVKDAHKLVIIEGLFAWRAPFDKLVDLKIYLVVNFWHRYVLRLQRNVVDLKVADFQKVTEQYFTFVAKAYIDLLEPEKAAADIIIENKIDIGEIQGVKDGSLSKLNRDIYSDDRISIYIDNEGSVAIRNRTGILFKEKVTDDIMARMLSIRDIIS